MRRDQAKRTPSYRAYRRPSTLRRGDLPAMRKRYMWHDVLGAICHTPDPCGSEEIACRVGAMECHRVQTFGWANNPRRTLVGVGDPRGMTIWSLRVLVDLASAGIIERIFDAGDGCNIWRLRTETVAIPAKWWPTNSPVLSG